MTARSTEKINPAILVWARESAGLNVSDAAKKLALNDSKHQTGSQKLLLLETGERLPTRSQLSKISKAYHRPLVSFYMTHPPKRGPRGKDFRSTSALRSAQEDAQLDVLLRDVQARQEMVKGILDDLGEGRRREFIGSATLDDDTQKLAKTICTILSIPTTRTEWASNADAFFKRLRAAVEAIGVFVLLAGDLGSHHSAIDEDVFRGFALADLVAPFIVINEHDAKTARSFTLVHELVHLFLGETGVSGTPELRPGDSAMERLEAFCNDVASHVLLPSDFATIKPDLGASIDMALSYVDKIAKRFLVSQPLVAFRLGRLGWVTEAQYRGLFDIFKTRRSLLDVKTRAENNEKESGPSYYVVKQYCLGDALVGVVQRTVRENLLTHTKAARVLGVKATSVETLLRRFETRGAALLEARR